MKQLHLLGAFWIVMVAGKLGPDDFYQANSSEDLYPVLETVLHDFPICRNLPICHFGGRLRVDGKNRKLVVNNRQEYRSKDEKTHMEGRSYYGNYAGNPMSPAIYPAIDTVSILASLAFIAFLLHSFAALFDRSRSMIPSIVSNRQATRNHEVPDPVKLILRALDEYDILSNNAVLDDTNGEKSTSR